MSMPGGPAEMSEVIWDSQMDVNLKSVYLCCHHVLPIMEAQKSGVIINMSSIAAHRYLGKAHIAYNTTKAAIIQFTKATAIMYARKGIRVNVVTPGLMHTPLIKSMADKHNQGDVEGLIRKRESSVPTGQMGNAHDVAYAVTFLSSQAARYITATELVVDGGMLASCPPG
jgi:NAD(P)-dependent dehydrogenase (short-subunit alcohol dehydrogenase family)